MSNMSYCRFENTNRDFEDCIEAAREMGEAGFDDLSQYEQDAYLALLRAAQTFLEGHGANVDTSDMINLDPNS